MLRLIQLTLDLFDAPAPPPAPSSKTNPPPARTPRAQPAPETIASAPAELLAAVLAPARFAHPQANREVVLGDTRVAYEFKRARRRNIGFAVGPEGLTVSAPKWVPLYEVEAAIQTKSAWIVRKLGEARERH
ncbi:MAG TPA: metal-dependent hydrolase, partial [Ramlibacter sp.]|nr:metal-dependent hydrolase [Ramlibacter sp.]